MIIFGHITKQLFIAMRKIKGFTNSKNYFTFDFGPNDYHFFQLNDVQILTSMRLL